MPEETGETDRRANANDRMARNWMGKTTASQHTTRHGRTSSGAILGASQPVSVSGREPFSVELRALRVSVV